ncbi:hypothetical protein ACI2KR_07995 [Pseudomonas luteola]
MSKLMGIGKETSAKLSTGAWWAMSVFLVLLALLCVIDSWITGIWLLAFSLVINPLIAKLALKNKASAINADYRIAMVWICLAGGAYIAHAHLDAKRETEQERAALEASAKQKEINLQKAEAAKREKEALIGDLNQNRSSILQNLDEALSSEDLSKATALFTKYRVTDDVQVLGYQPKIEALKGKVARQKAIQAQLDKLSTLSVNDYAGAVAAYSELVKLDPQNKRYSAGLDKNKAALAKAQEKAQKEERVRLEAEARQKTIEAQFSGWDGSHRGLERIIKASMNDPDSYEHVKTTYSDMGGNRIRVKEVFRGKNGFGGMVLNSITADFTIDGNLIRVVSQND